MIECRSKYYKAQLQAPEDKIIYDLVLAGLTAKQTEIVIGSHLTMNTKCPLNTIVMYVRMDNPGLFYVDFHKVTYVTSLLNRKFIFAYLYPPQKIEMTEKRIREKIEAIVAVAVTQKLTPYETELFLHDYLALNVNYEYQDKSYHKAHSAVGALLYSRSVCEGYSMAFKLLCDAAGISCVVVFGAATNIDGTANHAWNLVKIQGKCYHVDVTWDSCIRNANDANHTYFNLTDDDLSQDHVWDRELLPKCIDIDNNYFVRAGLLFTNSSVLKDYLVFELKRGKRSFSFRISNRLCDESQLKQLIHDSIKSIIFINLRGYKYSYQYDAKRGIANIDITTVL